MAPEERTHAIAPCLILLDLGGAKGGARSGTPYADTRMLAPFGPLGFLEGTFSDSGAQTHYPTRLHGAQLRGPKWSHHRPKVSESIWSRLVTC